MRVAGVEWGLALSAVFLAALTFIQTSYQGIVAVLIVIVAVSSVLVFVSAIQAVRTGVLGRFLLLAATMGFFWIEAFSTARSDLPFEVGTLLPLSGRQFEIPLVREAIFFCALFQLMLLVGYSIRIPLGAFTRLVKARIDQRTLKGRVLRYTLALCALIPLFLSYNFDLGAATEALIGGRATQNPAYQDVGLLNLISFFGLYGASLLLVESLLFRSLSRLQQLVIGALVTAPFVLGGVRHLWLFVAIPVGVVAFRVNAQKLTLGRLARWVAGALILLVIVQVQLLVRQEGWDQVAQLRPSDLLKGDATGQFEALLVAEALVPERHDYFKEFAEPYFMIHWIPRRVWPNKPVMESWTYYNNQYTQGDIRFNVTPSVIGQFYLNFGVFGVLYAGAFLGFLMVCADRLMLRIDPIRQRAVAVAIGSFVAFLLVSYRFYSPIYFTYFAFAWIGMLLITSRRSMATSEVGAPGLKLARSPVRP